MMLPVHERETARAAAVKCGNSFDCSSCRLFEVFQFIDGAPMKAITSESAAGTLRISTSRLRHLFKDHVGVSFQQYVIRLRLERARKVLLTEDIAIERVAFNLGVRDLSHFLRDFKRIFGVTPTELRRTESRNRTGRDMSHASKPDNPMRSV
jgi:AraC-like DNA-binding protein